MSTKYILEDADGIWEVTPHLRFVKRDGKNILQQRVMKEGSRESKWRDVPLVTEP